MTETQPVLTEDEIVERLRINDGDVINSAYTICLDLLYKEEDRSKYLDTKGATLVGVSGLTSTVVFSLGGLLIEKVNNVALPVIGKVLPVLCVLYLTSSVTLLASILTAVLAIKSRSDWKWIDDQDVFRQEVISKDIKEYKRYLAVHYWIIKTNNFRVNESKGKNLTRGYWLFFVALLQVLAIVVIIAFYSYAKGASMSDNKPPATPKPGAGASRTSGCWEYSEPHPRPAPKPPQTPTKEQSSK